MLRQGSELILGFTADVVLLREVLGGDAHVVIIECIPQTISDHGVDHAGMAHAQTGACARQRVVGQAHVFLAASNDDFGITAANRLGRQVQCLEARAADLVQGHGRYREGQARLDGSLSRRVLACAGGQHLAHDDFIDLRAVHAGLRQQLANDCSAKIYSSNGSQRPLETADGGTGGGDDNDVLHGADPHCY